MGYTFTDAYGESKWLNRPKNHPENLTLVNFDQPLTEEGRQAVQAQIGANFSKLSVVIGHKETSPGVYDGEETYTLIDTDKLNGNSIDNVALMAAVNAVRKPAATGDSAPF